MPAPDNFMARTECARDQPPERGIMNSNESEQQSDRKSFEKFQEILRVSHRTLDAANVFTDLPPLLEAFAEIVRNFTGCTGVGIRILDPLGGMPYELFEGFPDRDKPWKCQSNDAASPTLCADIINGCCAPHMTCCTEDGSFFANSPDAFAAYMNANPAVHMCSACCSNGCASMALIPLRSWDKTLGLIHMADARTDMLPLDKIQVLEKAALQLGIAVQRKQAMEEVERSQQNLKSVFDAIPDLIVICDRQLRIIMSNWKFHGAPEGADRKAGSLCFKTLMNRDAPCSHCAILRVFETGSPIFDEYENPQDGRIKEIRAFPIRSESGRIEHVVGNIRDITENKRTERMLLEAKREAEFYLDLMSHDLTNFNQVLLGNLKLLERRADLGEAALRNLETCKRQVAKTENLIAKVRAFSSVREVDRDMLYAVDIDMVIADCLKMFKTIYHSKQIHVQFAPEPGHHALATDLLEHVIINILENAVKHSERDPVLLDITVQDAEPQQDGFWEIRISDNGPGVPDEMKTGIFDRYARINHEKRGTGLGLSLCRAIIESFGGNIRVQDRVESQTEMGSSFVLTIPKK